MSKYNDKDDKEFKEFKEFKEWESKKNKEESETNAFVGKCFLVTIALFVILLIIGAIYGAVNKDETDQNDTAQNNGFNIIPNNNSQNDVVQNNNSQNNVSQPYELSDAEKFLIGEWRIHDVGYEDDYPSDDTKAYTTDPALKTLFEKAESYYFNFDGTVSFRNDVLTMSSKVAYLEGRGNIGCCTDAVIYAKNLNDKGQLSYKITHKAVNHNGGETALYFWHLHYTLPVDSVVGIRAQNKNDKDILRMTLSEFGKDRIIWYEFARV